MKLSVIVPVYNEQNTVISLLKRVHAQRSRVDNELGVELEVLVINDGSSDATKELLDSHPHLYDICVHQEKNQGKGAAVKEALKRLSGDFVVFQDADLEYDPEDYAALLGPALKHKADVVIGSRFNLNKPSRVFYFWHKMGNHLITLFFNAMNNTTFSDIYSCYIMFRAPLVRPEDLKTMGWEQQAELLTYAVNRGSVFYEVPISYHGRTYGEGKKIRWYHAVSVLGSIFRTKVRFLLSRQPARLPVQAGAH